MLISKTKPVDIYETKNKRPADLSDALFWNIEMHKILWLVTSNRGIHNGHKEDHRQIWKTWNMQEIGMRLELY